MNGSDVSGATHNDHAVCAQEKLKEMGLEAQFEIVLANDYTLQLDFDSLDTPPQFLEVLCILENQVGFTSIKRSLSKSGNGVHIVIGLRCALSVEQRIAWQAALGSDPKREALACCSVLKGEINPILLFERKRA